eukprot:COSAG03_NODE_305_length_9164_cov_3.264093_9_plen_142_part_00
MAKLKKHKIFPDLHASGKTEPEPEQPPSDLNPEYDVEPLAATLRERLELTAMLDASEQSTSARSVQLWKLVDEELQNSRDHKMRTAMDIGRGKISKTMKCVWSNLTHTVDSMNRVVSFFSHLLDAYIHNQLKFDTECRWEL